MKHLNLQHALSANIKQKHFVGGVKRRCYCFKDSHILSAFSLQNLNATIWCDHTFVVTILMENNRWFSFR